MKRPNLLFILAEGQSPFNLKVYDPSSKLETLDIDPLAREGMVFEGIYHMESFSGAVCTPSFRRGGRSGGAGSVSDRSLMALVRRSL